MKTKKSERGIENPQLELKPREKTAVRRWLDGKRDGPNPRLKRGDDKRWEINHPVGFVGNALLMDAVGALDEDFVNGLIHQLINTGRDELEVNYMLSVIKGIKPRDQIEAMLATQMAAVQMISMRLVPQIRDADFAMQLNAAGGVFSKLARTFAAQIESLDRHRANSNAEVQQREGKDHGQPNVGKPAQDPIAANPEDSDRRPEVPRTVPKSERPRSVPESELPRYGLRGREEARSAHSETGRPRSLPSQADRPSSIPSESKRPRSVLSEGPNGRRLQ